jgi:hypothetical protein
MSGKLVFKEDISIKAGNTQYELKLTNLPAGIYLLKVDDNTVTIQK